MKADRTISFVSVLLLVMIGSMLVFGCGGSGGGCPAGQSMCNSGENRCVPGASDQFQVCGDINADGCTRWGDPQTCPQGQICDQASGQCIKLRVPILADYDSELRDTNPRADGHNHVNSALLVDRLVGLNANTYAFLIYHDTKDWEDLQEYLPLAEAAGLRTWVYLVPPTELPADYPPYGNDYIAWGQAIGDLARSYPSLLAFAMDDFNGNLSTFTPATTCAMVQAARASQPDIRFYAVDYFSSVIRDFENHDFRGCIDGVIFPYINLDSNAVFRSQIEEIATLRTHDTLAYPDLEIIPMIYATGTSWHRAPPTTEIIQEAVSIALETWQDGISQGPITYCLTKDPPTDSDYLAVSAVYAAYAGGRP